MIFKVVSNKLHGFLLFFLNIFRRALCCFSRRRRFSNEAVPLTHVVSNSDVAGGENWDEWDKAEADRVPRTVQDHIELYRQQVAKKSDLTSEEPAPELNFFEDMTPRITKQTKLLVNQGGAGHSTQANRLNCVEDSVAIIPSSELGEWDENSGWDGDSLDADATKVLREKKRQERERRAWEQYQKRLEKSNRALGYKLNA